MKNKTTSLEVMEKTLRRRNYSERTIKMENDFEDLEDAINMGAAIIISIWIVIFALTIWAGKLIYEFYTI
jgi:hypothetical protein